MTTLTESPRNAGFILSEANGALSRENGVLKEGQNLEAGTVLQADGEELIARTSGTVVGILINKTDATSAAAPVAYLARQAEVILANLTYPDTTADPESETVTGLAALGIIAR